MTTVQLAGNNALGGVLRGNFGTYQAASDGTFTVDTRDAPAALAKGASYLGGVGSTYNFDAAAPLAATSGRLIASGALSNGSPSIANQPDVPRQAALIIGTGTGAITAGTIAVTYVGNDNVSGTDTLSLACPASSITTQFLSRGVAYISAATVAGLVGGTSPCRHLDTTAGISLPI